MHVDVYEKRGDPRLEHQVQGRSINLALSTRGLHALKEIGLDAALMLRPVRMYGRQVHDVDQTQHFLPYSPDPTHAIYSVSRYELNKLLLEKTQHYPR